MNVVSKSTLTIMSTAVRRNCKEKSTHEPSRPIRPALAVSNKKRLSRNIGTPIWMGC